MRNRSFDQLLSGNPGFKPRVTHVCANIGGPLLTWSTEIDIAHLGGAYVNNSDKVIYFRDPAITIDSETDYWLAWEENKTSGKIDHIWVNFVSSANPNEQIVENLISVTKGKTYMDLPLELLRDGVDFKIIAWFENKDDASTSYSLMPLSMAAVIKAKEMLGASPKDLSTRSENDPIRPLENKILTILQKNFVLDNPSDWTWLIASTAHHDDAEHAVDLSKSGDDWAPVYSPADGTVVHNKKDSSGNTTLIIEHETELNGTRIYWYSKFLHMQCDLQGKVVRKLSDGSLEVIEVGAQISARDIAGHVGNEGQSHGSHLHEEHFAHPNGISLGESQFFSTPAINMRRLLTSAEMKVNTMAASVTLNSEGGYTSNGGSLSVIWDKDLVAWVNTGKKLIYDRHEQEPGVEGGGSYWIAWHPDAAQRGQVRWDDRKEANGWYKWDESTNNWSIDSVSGKRKKWDMNIDANNFFLAD